MKKVWPFFFYFFYYGAASGVFPFGALYYHSIGLSGAQTGFLLGLAPLITLVGAPFWTGIADASHRHKLVLSITLIGIILWAIAVPFTQSFPVLLLLILFYAFFASPINSLADSATMSMLGDERAKYGRVRLGGTIGWGITAYFSSLLVASFGLPVIFRIFAVGMTLALCVAQGLVFTKVEKQTPFWSGVGRLVSNPRWVIFLSISLMAGIGIATVNTYQFVYMEEMGAAKSIMGLSLTLATLSEVPAMFYGDRLLKRFNPTGLLILGTAVTGLRLLLYAIFNTPSAILVIQVLHGLTFPIIWIAGVSFAHENAPQGLNATAQGLFGAVIFGFGSAIGSFVGGLLIDSLSGRGMYFVIGSIILAGLLVLSIIQKRYTQNAAKTI